MAAIQATRKQWAESIVVPPPPPRVLSDSMVVTNSTQVPTINIVIALPFIFYHA